jgi:S1-C subfamily serine protease
MAGTRTVLLILAAAVVLAPIAVGRPAAEPQVVAIDAGPADVATGVALGGGRVLTVAHVLEGGRRPIVVRGRDGVPRAGFVLRADPRLDLAVLSVPGLRADRLSLADGGRDVQVLLRRGAGVTAEGATVRRRTTARLVDQPGAPLRPTLELAADVERGDSGAPVVDAAGRLVGVVYASSTARPGTAYAVRSEGLRRLACDGC